MENFVYSNSIFQQNILQNIHPIMVITLQDTVWSQTAEEVHLRVIFSGKLEHKKLDILTHREFLKLHHPPLFCEIFLSNPIDTVKSKCRILENEVRFTLKKLESQDWETFEKIAEKAEKIQMKRDFVTDLHMQHEEDVKEKVQQKANARQKDMEKEISRDAERQKEIEKFNRSICQKESAKIEELRIEKPKKTRAICIPEVRKQGNITVEFTDRRFPTPKRESQDHLEQEWIKKQYEARKVVGFIEEDLKPEERNPEWLKEKAADFFGKKNYLGAISAYSTAIQLTPECYDLFLNRSACQMAMGNLQRCIEDCSRAYELLTPAVEANLSARIQCLARRGAALCKLGLMRQGLDELQAALKLNPADEKLRRDVEMIKQRLLEDSDTD
ncbi:dynein axonemal assembly factor 4 [Phlebotomus argentipes]|uniref:dynein axonemal assembly factor 4 n=1 Tax=Phlebotomus argentipes TaxID=94469 RepID=UPI002893390E|nr:dynein axonemal assembly factor 4 [Phlebotomus argentipes]